MSIKVSEIKQLIFERRLILRDFELVEYYIPGKH